MTGNGEEVRCATWGVHVGGLGSQVTNVRCKIHFIELSSGYTTRDGHN